MKYLYHCLTIIILFSVTAPVRAQKDLFIKDYLERLENSGKYLILVANTMPEEKYGYKASPNSLTFAENLMHIGYALDWHSQSLLGDRKSREWRTDTIYKTADKSKKEMVEIVNKTFNDAIKLIKNFETSKLDERLDYFGLSRTKRQILLLLSDHITHHRGQMLVYMRLNGLVPPRYVLFQ